MGCEGDKLTKEDKQAIQDMSTANLTVEYRVVPDIKLQNDFNPRFGLNWVKLNSWMMTEFDTVINLDTGKLWVVVISNWYFYCQYDDGHRTSFERLEASTGTFTLRLQQHTVGGQYACFVGANRINLQAADTCFCCPACAITL